jgi:hypothetical protein
MTRKKTDPVKIVSLEILRDKDPQNPREYSQLGTMACWHRRYKLGDVQPKIGPPEWLKMFAPKGSVILAVFMMDHSGLSLRVSPNAFQDADPQQWDWGQLGLIVASPEAIKEFFVVSRVTKKVLEKAKKTLEAEVRVYDQYLNNQCWGFIAKDDKGEQCYSCWGFFGATLEETGLKEAIPEAARPLLEEAWEQRH